MIKKQLFFVFLAIFLSLVFILLYWGEDRNNGESDIQVAPKKELNTSFSDPLRYVYVTEKNKKTLAVLDGYENKLVDTIVLEGIPDLVAVSSTQKTLFYAQKNQHTIYYVNMASGEKGRYAVKNPIQELSVKSDGLWIAYASGDKTVVFNTATADSVEIDSKGPVSFIFQPNSDNKLFIGEQLEGRLSSIDLTTKEIKKLVQLPQPISSLSFMPNGLALFFNSNGILHRYALLDDELQTFDLGGSVERPYVTSDSRRLLTLSKKKDELINFNTYTLKEIGRDKLLSVSSYPDSIASGWLEGVGIVVGKSILNSIDFDSHTIKSIQTGEQAYITFVHPDSKTLYATLIGSSDILVFDIRQQEVVARIDSKLSHPEKVIMLQGNTLCH